MASLVASLWNRGLMQLGNDLFATLRLRDRPGRDGCQSALGDCFADAFSTWRQIRMKARTRRKKWNYRRLMYWVKPTQYCIVSILKRWLACWGAKLSGKRLNELIERCNSVIRTILGDRGAVSRVGRKGMTKVFKHRRKSSSVPTLTESQTVKRMLAPDWAQKMICIIVSNRRTVSP